MAQLGLTERDVTNSVATSLAGSTQTAPTFWLNPQERRVLPDRRPDAGVPGRQPVGPGEHPGDRPPARAGLQVLGGLAKIIRDQTPAVVSHYNIQPVIDLYATTQDRDLGGVAARHPEADQGDRQGRAEGRDRSPARPGGHHEHRLLRPALRPAGRDRADLPADRRELPVVARPVRDHHRPARRAGRHRLDAVRHRHHALGARAHRRDHVHGRGHRQLHPGGQLRPRAAGRDRRRPDRPRWRPASPASARC